MHQQIVTKHKQLLIMMLLVLNVTLMRLNQLLVNQSVMLQPYSGIVLIVQAVIMLLNVLYFVTQVTRVTILEVAPLGIPLGMRLKRAMLKLLLQTMMHNAPSAILMPLSHYSISIFVIRLQYTGRIHSAREIAPILMQVRHVLFIVTQVMQVQTQLLALPGTQNGMRPVNVIQSLLR